MRKMANLIYYIAYSATSKGAARRGRTLVFLNVCFIVTFAIVLLNISTYLRLYKANILLLLFIIILPLISMKIFDKYFSDKHTMIMNDYQNLDKYNLYIKIFVYAAFILSVIVFIASGINWGRASVKGL